MIDDLEFIDTLWAERVRQLEDIDPAVLPILSLLMAASRNGHLCLSKSSLPAELQLSWNALPSESSAVVLAENRLYIQKHYQLENLFKQEWARLNQRRPEKPGQLEDLSGLLPEQRSAVENALSHSVSVITGGPGTGKTYTAGKLIQSLSGCRVAMAAPTGKAAMMLTQSIGGSHQAQTLHSMLGVRPGVSVGAHERPAPIMADLVLVDECSMIDVKLMVQLLRAIRSGTRLVLLGDRHQLPPVEAGMVFADLCQVIAPCQMSELTQVMRTERAELVEFARAVNEGATMRVLEMLRGSSSLEWECTADLHKVVRKCQPLWQSGSDANLLAQLKEFAFLSPLRKGSWGVEAVNALVRQTQPTDSPMPIMILENDYKLDLFNGEVGVLYRGRAVFPGRNGEQSRGFPVAVLPRFEPSYCLSVHKSQGSEFNQVCLLLPEGAEIFGRQVLYTAVTRAKKSLNVLGSQGVVSQTVGSVLCRDSGIVC